MWPTELQMFVWAVSVLLAAIAGYGLGWGVGWRKGARWRRDQPWDGVERRGQPRVPLDPPPTRRHRAPDQGA